ncbi:MAG: DUF1778 domain-containing protein [Deltaproteobacteria bacterium]|nr:DUF1778 domain-containing protein [Deltaproteobacteria bacterium]
MINTANEQKLVARITARVPDYVHSTLAEAAALLGATVSQFVVQSALERANDVIERERFVLLSDKTAKKFVDALENPPCANEKLKAAFRCHKDHFNA